jgi:arabinofuranosyltransferase
MSRCNLVTLLGMLGLTTVLLLSAWLCDDAYITFRTVDNVANGYGLRWNPVERVQSFTHPIWLFTLIPLEMVFGELYYSTILWSIFLSLLTYWLVLGSSKNNLPGKILALLSLLLSRAFIDFSTSGLEGPLAHLFLVLIITLGWDILDQRRVKNSATLLFFLLLSGILLCRLDLILLVGPLAILLICRRAPLKMVFLGLLPLLTWEFFSLVYYGSFIPNTAIAKLGGGIQLVDRLEHGWTYLAASVRNDPVTGLVLSGILGLSSFRFLKHRKLEQLPVFLGIGLYLVYVWAMGGGFMAGRFLAAPFLAAVMILGRSKLNPRLWPVVAGLILLAAFLGPLPTVFSGPNFGLKHGAFLGECGVADERIFYYPHTGLLRSTNRDRPNSFVWVDDGIEAKDNAITPITRLNTGFFGYFAGPGITIVDDVGLSDPLLARLAADTLTGWRAGHLVRQIPPGYLETVTNNEGMSGDTKIAQLENQIRLVTRGPLFSQKRWRAIWDLNISLVKSTISH